MHPFVPCATEFLILVRFSYTTSADQNIGHDYGANWIASSLSDAWMRFGFGGFWPDFFFWSWAAKELGFCFILKNNGIGKDVFLSEIGMEIFQEMGVRCVGQMCC